VFYLWASRLCNYYSSVLGLHWWHGLLCLCRQRILFHTLWRRLTSSWWTQVIRRRWNISSCLRNSGWRMPRSFGAWLMKPLIRQHSFVLMVCSHISCLYGFVLQLHSLKETHYCLSSVSQWLNKYGMLWIVNWHTTKTLLSNDSLPPGLWRKSPVVLLSRDQDQLQPQDLDLDLVEGVHPFPFYQNSPTPFPGQRS